MNGRSQGMTFWRPFCPSICITAGSESLHLVTLYFGGSRASVGGGLSRAPCKPGRPTGWCPGAPRLLTRRPALKRSSPSALPSGSPSSPASTQGSPPAVASQSRPLPPPYLLPLPAGLFHPGAGGAGQRSGDGGRRAPPRAPAQLRP